MNKPAPAAAPLTIYFYRKHGCHLCDDMARELLAVKREWAARDDLRPFKITERDISQDARWYSRYHECVPALAIVAGAQANEQPICYYFLEQDELQAALSCSGLRR